MLVLDLNMLYDCLFWDCFCICNNKEGLFTFTILFTSTNLACIRDNFDFTELYLKVICYLITSSDDAFISKDRSSMNLYSIFYIKSREAFPSLYITKTAKKLWGSLMQEFNIFITIWASSGYEIVSF